MWITWNHRDTDFSWPLTFDQKVELFYEQALGWQIHIAELVANGGRAFGEEGSREGALVSHIRHSGFAVLQICLSYFETVGRYTGEQGGSKAAFRRGLVEVLPDLATSDATVAQAFADCLYRDARCGLYHNTRSARVGLAVLPEPFAIAYDHSTGRVSVLPERLPGVLRAHLERYRAALLDSTNVQLRESFEAQFDRDSGAA